MPRLTENRIEEEITTKYRSIHGGLRAAAAALLIGAPPLAAQQAGLEAAPVSYAPHFFMAVIGGVILAIGFQILLTSVSIASGISLVGNLEKGSGEDEGEKSGHGNSGNSDEEDSGAPIYKVTSAIGIWTLVTASVSLFFASLLAVRLSWEGTVWMGVTLGLIIWASFFALMTYLEVRSASTLIGGVFSAALSGLRTSFNTLKSAFGKSPEDRILGLATGTVDHLREELSQALDDSQITEKLDEYVQQLKPQPLDYEKAKADLVEILQHVKLEEHAEVKEGQLDRETFLKLAREHPRLSKENMNKLSHLFDEARQAVTSSDKGSGKVEALVDQFGPGDTEEGRRARQTVESYLKETGREEVDPDRIKQDIDKMFDDPKAAPEVLKHRLGAIDRDTIVSVLSQRDDISQEKADKIVTSVEKALDFVRQKATRAQGEAAKAGDEAASAGKGMTAAAGGLPRRVEDRLRQYMDSIGRPEFNYDRIRLDFERIFHHPKEAPTIVKARLKMYDRESLIALLSAREDVSREDAERMVQKIDEARDRVLRKVDRIEEQVRHRVEDSRRLAIHEAENVRKASASAAWWMVGTAVGSGAFSALGAALAVTL